MNKLLSPAFILLLVFISGYISSCKDHEDYKYFLIQVNNVEIPGEILANQPFELKLSGTIGYDGCSSFERFITEDQDSLLFIEPWGKVKLNTYACPQEKIELGKERLKYVLDKPGNYSMLIKQPDGSFFEQQITVK